MVFQRNTKLQAVNEQWRIQGEDPGTPPPHQTETEIFTLRRKDRISLFNWLIFL